MLCMYIVAMISNHLFFFRFICSQDLEFLSIVHVFVLSLSLCLGNG